MPKLNYKKLPYRKVINRVKPPKTNSFYEPIQCDDEIYKKIYRGYHMYDYFGKTIRRHEDNQGGEYKWNTKKREN